jgi:hypothetical protein
MQNSELNSNEGLALFQILIIGPFYYYLLGYHDRRPVHDLRFRPAAIVYLADDGLR